MRILSLIVLSSLVVACSTHPTHHKTAAKDKLIRGSVITFEKRVTLKNSKTAKGLSQSLVKTTDVQMKQTGRSIASTCDFVKFCKLNARNINAHEEATVYGDYTVLTTGKYNSNSLKSWTLVNSEGNELQLICGIQAQNKDKACSQKLSNVQIKDITPFIEKLLEVRVAAAK